MAAERQLAYYTQELPHVASGMLKEMIRMPKGMQLLSQTLLYVRSTGKALWRQYTHSYVYIYSVCLICMLCLMAIRCLLKAT